MTFRKAADVAHAAAFDRAEFEAQAVLDLAAMSEAVTDIPTLRAMVEGAEECNAASERQANIAAALKDPAVVEAEALADLEAAWRAGLMPDA